MTAPIDSTQFCLNLYLTHVASQVIYRYIPGPERRSENVENTVDGTFRFSSKELVKGGPMSRESWEAVAERWLREGPGKGLSKIGGYDFAQSLALAAQRNFEQTLQGRGTFLVLGSIEYPPLLGNIADPPLVLAVVGNPKVLLQPTMSVVGSRKASGWGLKQSVAIGVLAARRGTTVVSGGAFGCDIAVHRGMLRANQGVCPAAVVMASGLGHLYPRAHHGDFQDIVQRGGALISERLWWGQSQPFDFLVRNRLIAGLSPVTVVAEAGERSGALTTARMALDQGREVLVLEGEENDVRSKGNQQLIDDGAAAFESAICLMESTLLQ